MTPDFAAEICAREQLRVLDFALEIDESGILAVERLSGLHSDWLHKGQQP